MCWLFPGAVGCSELTLPTGDELAGLNRAYDEPRGHVDVETMESASTSALERLDTALSLGRLDFVVDSLSDVSEVVQEVARDEGGSRFRLDAVATVEKICPGAGGEPDPENGLLIYTIRVQENGVLDTVWGEFEGCTFPDPGETFPGLSSLPREPGSLVTYDGSMDVYLGGNLLLRDFEVEHFLFRLDGVLEIGGSTVEAALDFRVRRDRRTEVRVPATDGDVVFSFLPGQTAVGLETGDGLFCCDLDQRFCVSSDGAACDMLEAGDRVLEW